MFSFNYWTGQEGGVRWCWSTRRIEHNVTIQELILGGSLRGNPSKHCVVDQSMGAGTWDKHVEGAQHATTIVPCDRPKKSSASAQKAVLFGLQMTTPCCVCIIAHRCSFVSA